jgi:hypothetical protein
MEIDKPFQVFLGFHPFDFYSHSEKD